MPSDSGEIRLLLDEHYPGWLADKLTADGIDTVAVTAHRPQLRGADGRRVLEVAVPEHRVVVTEDASTFANAIADVPSHVGVIYCHHSRFPRNRSGLDQLHHALVYLIAHPPAGLGTLPVIWWLEPRRTTT